MRFAKDTDSPAALAFSKCYTKVSPPIRDLFNSFLKKGPDSITIVDLKNLNFSEVDCEMVAKLIPELNGLNELILVNNGLGNYGMNQLTDSTSSLVKLEKLVLSGNLINDECLDMICPTLPFVKNIKAISFADNMITDRGCELLAQGIENFEFLEELDLTNNKISYSGFVSIANSVKSLQSFKDLKFDGNGLKPKEIEKLLKLLPKLSSRD